jgi:hypothetical protein
VHKLGSYALIIGAILTISGLTLGFGFMFAGHDGPTKLFLAAVPMGFLIGFFGVVMTLLGESETND